MENQAPYTYDTCSAHGPLLFMQDVTQQLAHEVAKECKTVDDVHNMLKELFKGTLQEIFEAEIEEHLGYVKNSAAGNNSGNSRNQPL